jgi:hypothetical protein
MYRKEYQKKWRKENPDKVRAIYTRYMNKEGNREKRLLTKRKYHFENRARELQYRRMIKQKCLDAYGGRCACCGESLFEFLAIDHIGGGGNEHRRLIGLRAGYGFHRWLIKNNFPNGFRVLCHNCNMSMGAYGYCPHSINEVR